MKCVVIGRMRSPYGCVEAPHEAAIAGRAAMKKHVILFLAANPRDTGRLALDREARAIHVELKRSGYRDRFDFVTRWAAEPLDLLRELRELKPTIVHFSGHGEQPAGSPDREQGRGIVPTAPSGDEPGGVMFDSANGRSQLVTPEAIARTFGAAGAQVRLVVLNACYSAPIAEALRGHVDCVVGMSGAIHDDAARSFAIGFYGGLGEHESISAAFEQAKAAIHLGGLPDADRPQLQVRDGFDPAELILAAIPPSGLVAIPAELERVVLDLGDVFPSSPASPSADVRISLTNLRQMPVKLRQLAVSVIESRPITDTIGLNVAAPIPQRVLRGRLTPACGSIQLLPSEHILHFKESDGFKIVLDAEEGYEYDAIFTAAWHEIGGAEAGETSTKEIVLRFPTHTKEGLRRLLLRRSRQ
jgi:hypothetical protein